MAPKEFRFFKMVSSIRRTPQWISVTDTQVVPLFNSSTSCYYDASIAGKGFGTVRSAIMFEHRCFIVNSYVMRFSKGYFMRVYLKIRALKVDDDVINQIYRNDSAYSHNFLFAENSI